jgi:hypothetical protein
MGNKISYTDGGEEFFIPTNGRIGANLFMELDDYNTVSFALDVNKLLVPTPPVYAVDEDNNPLYDENGNRVVEAGVESMDVGTLQGMFQSFSDAPGGSKEELNELMYSAGIEYWYMNQFAFRGGYFHEHETKGNRKYFTLGFGYKMSMFSLDMAYLVSATRGQKSPLANTMRFSMIFDMNALMGPAKTN